MDFRLQNILKKIESLRDLMYSTLSDSGQLTEFPILNCSKQLDEALNEYESYKKSFKSGDAA